MRCRQGTQANKSKILALNKTLSEYFKIEVVSGLQFQIEEVFA